MIFVRQLRPRWLRWLRWLRCSGALPRLPVLIKAAAHSAALSRIISSRAAGVRRPISSSNSSRHSHHTHKTTAAIRPRWLQHTRLNHRHYYRSSSRIMTATTRSRPAADNHNLIGHHCHDFLLHFSLPIYTQVFARHCFSQLFCVCFELKFRFVFLFVSSQFFISCDTHVWRE